MIVADCSNWSRVPTQADIDALRALGVEGVIVGTSFPHNNGDGTFTYIGEAQCQAFEGAGFAVEEYQFPTHLRQTPRRWWLDVEEGESDDVVIAAIVGATSRPEGIYTRRSVWGTLDIKAHFPWLRLWEANYGPLPRPFVPFGGFTARAVVQYQDTTDIGTGFMVDLSVTEGRHMYTDTEIDAKIGALLEQLAALGVKLDALQASTEFLITVVNALAAK